MPRERIDAAELRRRVQAFVTKRTKREFLKVAEVDNKTLDSFLAGERETRPKQLQAIGDAMAIIESEEGRPLDIDQVIQDLLKQASKSTKREVADYIEYLLDRGPQR